MILIVDDKPENIFSLKKVLELHKFEVDSALSGEEALKKILKNTYALIILDVQMPGMDGFEVAETISGYSKSKDIPIIFLSAVNTEKQFIKRGYDSGGMDYVTKPVDPDILLLKVKTFYRLYEQNRELNEVQKTLREEIEFRKQAQSELRERNQELRSILESIPQIAFTAKSNGDLEFVNKHWFEYSDNEEEFPENHPENESIHKRWEKAVASGTPLEMEVRLKKLNAESYHYHILRASPVMEEQQIKKWVGTFTNIEEQKQGEKRKDEFLSIASHELKTPLTSIKAYIQLLGRALEDKDPSDESRKYLDRTQFQLQKLQSLIADLLDISKIESGKLQFDKKIFDFDALLENALDIIRQTNPDYNIIKTNIRTANICGDDMRIEQVILNYLTNAIKYSPDSKDIEVSTVINDENDLVFTVKDTGVGIPKHKQSQIFQKFYRVEENSHRFQGLGIGLYICSEIIRRHKGTVGVDSVPNKGSKFYFTLPLSN
jgi:signal transduction histidine kinase